MSPPERLPLIKQALKQLVNRMGEKDRVAIVVYASEAGVRLVSTPCSEKEKILAVIDSLTAGGSTNGGDGIQQAYRVARENFIEGGVNRVLLATDGDFNVGMVDQNELVRMVQEKAKSGVFLTTLGVGTDNYKDALMQKLADRGNGNYFYLDNLEEAQKVLLDQMRIAQQGAAHPQAALQAPRRHHEPRARVPGDGRRRELRQGERRLQVRLSGGQLRDAVARLGISRQREFLDRARTGAGSQGRGRRRLPRRIHHPGEEGPSPRRPESRAEVLSIRKPASGF
jgi:hypothetical protein